MSTPQSAEFELSLEEANKIAEVGRMAEELSENHAFKKLVLEGYFVEEASRLVHLLADPSMEKEQERITQAMHGIANFRQYLTTRVQMGRMAENEIRNIREAMVEMEQEDLH